MKDRFCWTKGRSRPSGPFNKFKIIDRLGRIPDMHFLIEEDMMIVFDLLDGGHMRFSYNKPCFKR